MRCQAVTVMHDESGSCRCNQSTDGEVCVYHAKMANGLLDPVTDESFTHATKPVQVRRADTGEVLWER